jgi:succinyl-diaminopimelate desuccinylase
VTFNTLDLTEQLLSLASTTPQDAGCQGLIRQALQPLGFDCHTLMFGPPQLQVTNLWALKPGQQKGGPLLVLAGHTDVVPTGPLEQWASDPFVPHHRDGFLYGRGAADMKTSLAAMVVAAQEFITSTPHHRGSLAFLLTSDEEGPSVDGTVKVCQWLQAQSIRPDYCIVGEPTSVKRLGDVIKNGRRGSLSGQLTVHGVQGHIAYPHLAQNPIHLLAPALAELASMQWDAGNTYFPPTAWQVSNIHAGTGATNVIPGDVVLHFNFRFSTESTAEALKALVHAVLDRHGVPCEVLWTLGGEPFITEPGALSQALSQAIEDETGQRTELSTTGGTSDARFIAKICPQVVEFGPVNATIHQINERIEVASIEPLKNIYLRTLESLLT